jgi:hypothetical protein
MGGHVPAARSARVCRRRHCFGARGAGNDGQRDYRRRRRYSRRRHSHSVRRHFFERLYIETEIRVLQRQPPQRDQRERVALRGRLQIPLHCLDVVARQVRFAPLLVQHTDVLHCHRIARRRRVPETRERRGHVRLRDTAAAVEADAHIGERGQVALTRRLHVKGKRTLGAQRRAVRTAIETKRQLRGVGGRKIEA